MSISNTGSIDLQSVLNVRRRTLASIGERNPLRYQPNYTDTIYLKREDKSNSILTFDSKIVLFGELQLLYSIFERYTSDIVVYEDSIETVPVSPISSAKPSFSATLEEDEHDESGPPLVSTLRKISITSAKDSPTSPQLPSSPIRKQTLGSIGRSQTTGSTTSEYSVQSLEGKRYGCVRIPNMGMIEILEILLRTGLVLVNVSSDYDGENILHQNFVFSKIRSSTQKSGLIQSRSASITGT